MNACATASARSSGHDATSAAISPWASSPAVPCRAADHGPPQPLDVVEQALAAGLAEHLAQQVAEQPDIPAHRRRHVLAVGVPAHDARVATARPGAGRGPISCGLRR